MTKTIALTSFHGANFANVYEQGKEYYFESAIAKSLAARKLVSILADKEEAVEETPSHQETKIDAQVAEAPKVEEPAVVKQPKEEVADAEVSNVKPETIEMFAEETEAPKAEAKVEENAEEKPKRGRKPSVVKE